MEGDFDSRHWVIGLILTGYVKKFWYGWCIKGCAFCSNLWGKTMLNLILSFTVVVVAIGCKTASESKSDPKFLFDRGPSVNQFVLDDQEQWLRSQTSNEMQARFDHLVVFGDSLSDQGLLNKNTFGLMVKPDTFWKSRWSNGPNWVDYVSAALQTETMNYAVGGAETADKGNFFEGLVIPSLFSQLESFRKEKDRVNFDRTLVTIWIGPNNYFNEKNSDIDLTVEDIINSVKSLKEMGAKHIVVGNMSLLGISPSSLSGDGKSPEVLKQNTFDHNARLLEGLSSNEGLDISLYDAFSISRDMHDNYLDYGFETIDQPCYKGDIRGNYQGEKFCKNSMATKYWDATHPNTMMFCYYAAKFLQDLPDSDFELSVGKSRCQELLVVDRR